MTRECTISQLQTSPEKNRYSTTALDWRAYFYTFCEEHGKHPVRWKGRLLFMDGWMYSSTDYKGPEYPPPDDPYRLRHLKRMYWKQRRAAVKYTLNEVSAQLESVEMMQKDRSVPLQQVTMFWDAELKKHQIVRGPVDLTVLKMRVKHLQDDMTVCDQRLDELDSQELVGVTDGESRQ